MEQVTKENYYIGMEVVRGKDWEWSSQDGGSGNIGIIIEEKNVGDGNFWVRVEWKNGKIDFYRVGPKWFDLLTYSGEIYELW